jgi:hypothetical protein
VTFDERKKLTARDIAIGKKALLALILGGLFAYGFLTIHDPDTVARTTIDRAKWFILCPLTFLLGLWAGGSAWLSGLSVICGVFIGACIAALMPPHSSNIWPIAAAFWTVLWLPPVLVGSLAGGLAGWSVRKMWKK